MIDLAYVRIMARYNRWQNQSIYGAADTLSEADRREHRGAFFRSIQGTLNHLLWGDKMWLSRFAGTPRPRRTSGKESVEECETWAELKTARAAFDETIITWAEGLDPAWLSGDLVWLSGLTGKEMKERKDLLVAHFFNHQTHHRGQVHCLLTQFGAKPDDTDIFLMPKSQL